jgi:hypothetical protein
MKVLFAGGNGYHPEFYGGMQSSTHHVAEQLRDRAHDAAALAALFGDSDRDAFGLPCFAERHGLVALGERDVGLHSRRGKRHRLPGEGDELSRAPIARQIDGRRNDGDIGPATPVVSARREFEIGDIESRLQFGKVIVYLMELHVPEIDDARRRLSIA